MKKFSWIFIVIIILIIGLETFAQSSAQELAKNKHQYSWLVVATICYGFIVFLLSRADQYMELAKVNAIWSSMSVISVAVIGTLIFNQKLTKMEWFSMIIISLGFGILLIPHNKKDRRLGNIAKMHFL